MQRIGVRELRQHASKYLALVQKGERLEVMDRGRPVAMLVPVEQDPWRQMLASGRVTPPSDPTDIADEEPLEYDADFSAILAELRDSER